MVNGYESKAWQTVSIKHMYDTNKQISICALSWKLYMEDGKDTIDIKVNGNWVYNVIPPISIYNNYVHTYSPNARKRLGLDNKS